MTDLQAAHTELLTALAALAEVLSCAVPDRAALANARWKLSRASRLRRKVLAETVYPLIDRAGGSEKIAALRREDSEHAVISAQHIGRWTPDAVLADIGGYRDASAAMRRAMQARIKAEQAVLYPLLASIGQHA